MIFSLTLFSVWCKAWFTAISACENSVSSPSHSAINIVRLLVFGIWRLCFYVFMFVCESLVTNETEQTFLRFTDFVCFLFCWSSPHILGSFLHWFIIYFRKWMRKTKTAWQKAVVFDVSRWTLGNVEGVPSGCLRKVFKMVQFFFYI